MGSSFYRNRDVEEVDYLRNTEAFDTGIKVNQTKSRLTDAERKALAPYAAAVPLYAAALDGFTEDPAGKLRTRLPFLRLSEWILAHPEVMMDR